MTPASARPLVDRELSLAEMLADPIVKVVMARDGVTRREVEGLIDSLRDGSARRQLETRGIGARSSGVLAFRR